ncbi:MAG: ABC transporter permease, partial [bacterium]
MRDRPGQSSLAKILLIGWREFRHTALTKGFIFGAIGVPILMFGVMALVPLLASRESPPLVGTIVVADPTGTILPRAKAILAEPPPIEEVAEEIRSASRDGTGNPAAAVDAMSRLSDLAPQKVEVEWRSEASLGAIDAIKNEVREGRVLAGVVVPAASLDPSADATPIELLIPSSLPPTHIRHITRSLRQAVEDERIARSGVDAALIERLATVPEPATTRISPEGAEAEERTEIRLIVPLAFMLLLWISIFTSANYLLTTTIEEKSNRVMEVLLAAVSPMQLLCGKIAGYSLVSLVMLVMYGGLGLAGLAAAAMLDLVDASDLVYLVIYFAMAYIMVSAMMA